MRNSAQKKEKGAFALYIGIDRSSCAAPDGCGVVPGLCVVNARSS
jgi:hypothetical protein